ncbi:MAG: NAD(P)/FAD-dependent oxidoreductase [Planktomarina sp.]
MTSVTRLPRDPGPAGWNDILPQQADPVRLEDDIDAEWLVIGAGFAGLTAAHRLHDLHPRDRIAVLDGKRLATGPAARDAGYMIDVPHHVVGPKYFGEVPRDKADTAANRAAVAYASGLAAVYDMSIDTFDPCGQISAAATTAGHQRNVEYAQHLTQMGEGFEVYDAARMAAITGSDYYTSGLFTPGAVILQPAAYLRSLADGLRAKGVQIYEHSPVLSLKRKLLWRAKTPLGFVNAPKVVLAVNGHVESFGFFQNQLVHVYSYASVTRVLSDAQMADVGGDVRWALTPADRFGTTMRRIGNRIMICSRCSAEPSMMVNDARLRQVKGRHRRSLSVRFPMLKGGDLEHTWGTRSCLTRNGVAAFGEVDRDLFSACGQNGVAPTKGTLHGMLAADMASGIHSDLLGHVLAEDPPQKLPPAPFGGMAVSAMICMGQMRAGMEL